MGVYPTLLVPLLLPQPGRQHHRAAGPAPCGAGHGGPGTRGATAWASSYRDQLYFHLKGNRILMRTTAHYWLEVGLKAGPYIKGVVFYGKGPEGFRQISFLNYDITDQVVAGMQENLQKATAAMSQSVQAMTLLRQKAEVVWAQAQQPIALAEGIWLNLNPEHLRLAPLTSESKVLTITPELQARLSITLGPAPLVARSPLPPLDTAVQGLQPGFRIRVEADLSFEHATAQMKKQMVGKRFDTEKGSFEVLDAAVFGEGDKAILELQLKGRVTGKLHLAGRLVQQGLNRSLLPGIKLAGHLTGMSFGQPYVLADRFRMDALLEGQLQVEVATQERISTLAGTGKPGPAPPGPQASTIAPEKHSRHTESRAYTSRRGLCQG